MTMNRTSLPAVVSSFSIAMAALLAGCSDHMKLETDMRGDLATTLKLDGPIQMSLQMQGPTIRYEGTYISDELLGHVEVGKTTGEWVLAVFGKPDAQTALKDGTEIWRWVYHPVEQQVSMVEMFSSSEKEPKLAAHSVFVMLRAGVVVEKWKG